MSRERAEVPEIRPFVVNHNVFQTGPGGSAHATIDCVLTALNGNSGNPFITYALARFFDLGTTGPEGIANMWTTFADGGDGVDEAEIARINTQFTHVFFVFQDQVQGGLDHLPWRAIEAFIERLTIPIVAFSLGANGFGTTAQETAANLAPAQVAMLRTLGSRALSLGIRGTYTAEVLRRIGLGNFSVVGCPTFYAAGPRRRIVKGDYDEQRRILAGGLFASFDVQRLHFMLQSEDLFVRSRYEGEPASALAATLIRTGYPGYAASVMNAVMHDEISFFASPAAWEAFVREGRFLMSVGTRVHGSIMALNAGIPALLTSGDARAAEMAALFKIPMRPGIAGADFTLRELYDGIDLDPMNAAYDTLYGDFVAWLEGMKLYSGLYPLPRPGDWREPDLAVRPPLLQRLHLMQSILA